MKTLLFLLNIASSAFAADCRQALAPQALTDLSQMHETIERARSNSTDTVYVLSLENAFLAKAKEIMKKAGLTRLQLNTILYDYQPTEVTVNNKTEMQTEEELIANALNFIGPSKNDFVKKLTELLINPLARIHPEYDNYIKLIKGFLLLHKYADLYDASFNLNKKIKLDYERTTTILHRATDVPVETSILKEMIDAGIDINSQNSEEETVLFLAIENKDYALAEFLIKAGADLNISNNRGTHLLDNAIINKKTKLIKFLVTGGIDISGRSEFGNFINTAVIYNSTESAKYLIENGAMINWNVSVFKLLKVAGLKHTVKAFVNIFKKRKGLK